LQDEIEIAYENGDRSVFGKVTFGQWETEVCSENQCCLFSEKLLPELNVMLRLQVTYTVQDSIVIKKITCCQNHILNLYISLSQRIRHPETEQIWEMTHIKKQANSSALSFATILVLQGSGWTIMAGRMSKN
jgi:hypothetical protein